MPRQQAPRQPNSGPPVPARRDIVVLALAIPVFAALAVVMKFAVPSNALTNVAALISAAMVGLLLAYLAMAIRAVRNARSDSLLRAAIAHAARHRAELLNALDNRPDDQPDDQPGNDAGDGPDIPDQPNGRDPRKHP